MTLLDAAPNTTRPETGDLMITPEMDGGGRLTLGYYSIVTKVDTGRVWHRELYLGDDHRYGPALGAEVGRDVRSF